MNRNSLKTYAPQARRDFIQAMKTRAAFYGITETKITPMQVKGDVAVIGGQEHPRAIAGKRQKLQARITRSGYDQTMEALAYTWFNRFAAIRYMEVNGFLGHGYRVLSHPEGKEFPEILEHAEDVDLPGLSSNVIRKLKIEGNRERDIYRMTLVAQCNALHEAMPFLFEKIDDETELLLPDNLLNSDSIIGKLVSEIEEADWRQIEIIGWLYQFYISEKKDQVIGKVVKSEDIPAATQLFTPNWIVKYMVQNSLGAMWLATYPTSSVRAGMAYFVPPADQAPEVAAQIASVTPKEIDPEKITFFDPAIGSGHIVVEAYDLFLAIYMDRGYQKRDAVRSILTKNLFGLDIDDRAAQLAGFALLMKARADDRTILKNPPKLNIFSVQDSAGINADDVADALLAADAKFELVPSGDLMPETLPQPTLALHRNDTRLRSAIKSIVALFEEAKTFGSLLTVPQGIMACLSDLESLLARPIGGDLFAQQAQTEARDRLAPLVAQARILGRSYDCVVANPPYMGRQYQNGAMRAFLSENFAEFANDIYSAFVGRSLLWKNEKNTRYGFMTPFTWLSKSNFESMRRVVIGDTYFNSLIQPEYHAFFEHAFVPICTFAFATNGASEKSLFIDLGKFTGAEIQGTKALEAISNLDCEWAYRADIRDFAAIPSATFTFSFSQPMLEAFKQREKLGTRAKKGITTGDNEIFMRRWHEVSQEKFSQIQGNKWFPITKGGDYRKWYGNLDFVVDWEDDGSHIKNFIDDNGSLRSVLRGLQYQFEKGITWNDVTISDFTGRFVPDGCAFSAAGPMIFHENVNYCLGMLNSTVSIEFLRALCPTMKFEVGAVAQVPVGFGPLPEAEKLVERAIELAKFDWDAFERSWEFVGPLTLEATHHHATLEKTYEALLGTWQLATDEMRQLEIDNNKLFIDAYGLADDLKGDVPLKQVTLTCNPHYRYSGIATEEDRQLRMRFDTIRELISYAIGCLMGRYSLDESGLIYAHSGNINFDASRYLRFPASDDGIIPLLDRDWGIRHDTTTLFEKFIEIAWPKESLEANLKFVADSLGPNNGEAARDTIRRYLLAGFYKHHLTTYKKRPIYWLFSSGKERAFQCLVYLHRYNDSTLARIRIAYVVPLQGKIRTRIEQLADDISKAPSTSHRRKLQKEQDELKKQQVELNKFEENLNHYAEKQISLDLDDGVKVNYGKFGDLLAEAKAITGGKDDE